MPGANRYTTAEFLTSIKRTGHIPSSQTPFQDADLLALADYELQTALLRQILSTRENFYLTYDDAPVNSSGIYDIPTRAIGGALAKVQLVSGTSIYHIVRNEVGDQFSTLTSPSGDYSFYLQGNAIVVRANPTTGVIRLWHYRRPNTLIAVSAAAQISAIDTGTGVLTFSSPIPATITTATPTDLIKDQPHFDWVAIDAIPTAVTSTTITFSSLPNGLSVGDWVSLSGQTAVPQIPVEFRPLLLQRVVVKYCEIQGYLDKMKAAQAKLQEMERDVTKLINPRVSEEPKRITPDSSLIGGYRRGKLWLAT